MKPYIRNTKGNFFTLIKFIANITLSSESLSVFPPLKDWESGNDVHSCHSSQHCTGGSSQGGRAGKRNERCMDWKETSKTVFICRRYNYVENPVESISILM